MCPGKRGVTLKAPFDRKWVDVMFSDNLSASISKLCEARHLSYETASELCRLSARYFGDIARGKTKPTVETLEKLCGGLGQTPNDLLMSEEWKKELAFRAPMPVGQIRCRRRFRGVVGFPVCPQCGGVLEREGQPYCGHCGQRLAWNDFAKATLFSPDG